MTISEQILWAVAKVVAFDANSIFSREDIRIQAGISREDWKASYSPIFQGMRMDQPGGAPNVRDIHKNIFVQVGHGKHTLTDYGRGVVATMEVKFCPNCIKEKIKIPMNVDNGRSGTLPTVYSCPNCGKYFSPTPRGTYNDVTHKHIENG